MNSKLVIRLWEAQGVPRAVAEHRFHPERKWRFDYAFPAVQSVPRCNEYGEKSGCITYECGGVAVEVQGGIWTKGRHTRGAALLKEWEKLNTAAALGWRVLFVAPGKETSTAFVTLLEQALSQNPALSL